MSGPKAVVNAAQGAREFAELAGLGDDAGVRLCIVIEELVANICAHGEIAQDAQIRLSLTCENDAVDIEMFDGGKAFDPRLFDVASEPDPQQLGGIGLHLVHAWADIVSYDRVSNGNTVRLRMKPAAMADHRR